MNKGKIAVIVLSGVLLVGGGVGVVTAYDKPIEAQQATVETSQAAQAEAPVAESPTSGKVTLAPGEYEGEMNDGMPHGQGSYVYNNGDTFVGTFANGYEVKGTFTAKGKATQEVEYNNIPTTPKDPNNKGHRVPVDLNDGLYHLDRTKPAGIIIYSITYHEGYRAPNMKAVDVHIMARSNHGENELIQSRDEITSITTDKGRVYDMKGTKRTGVNTNAAFDDFQEQEITQYQDIRVDEKVVSIVVRRDGQLITIKPDKDTKFDTTHP